MPDEQLWGGRYRRLDFLGEGGEAQVFRAVDTLEVRDVALRLPKNPGTAKPGAAVTRQNPGWVQVLGMGVDIDAGPYQVLELLRGETLGVQVRRQALAASAWNQFVVQSLAALEALHHEGWAHGDLNAENFMFIPETARWKLLELPFLHFSPLKERSTAFGSIHTLSPEQLQGRTADVRSDLYALGCLYYFAASGEWPHPGNRSQEVAISILRFAPQELRIKAGHLPPAAVAGVMHLLDREPARRCPSVEEARRLLAVA